MTTPQPPDPLESTDDTPGPDHCMWLDEHWNALRRESGPDLRQRRIDRDPSGETIAGELEVLNLLHQVRCVSSAGGETSQLATAWLPESFATKARSRPSGTAAVAAPTGMEGRAMVDEPHQIGKYQVLERLGSGGQAEVFRVFNPTLAKECALKLAHRPMPIEDQADRDALLREGRLLAQCEHPNLVPVFDLDVHEGRWFVVMEYVSGLNVQQFVAQRRPEPRQAARLVIELAQAVAYLHTRGITHQDIKPQNVLIDDRGRPRLIDFGLAVLKHAWRDAAADWSGGTARYMSPEQAEGRADRIGPRTDVFGLGSVLYYLLTGRPLYAGSSRASTLRLAQKADYIPVRQLNPRVPRSLARICHKALAADPERRYAMADELERALRRSLKRPWIAAVGLIALVAFTAVVWFVLRTRPQPTPAEPTTGPAPASALPASSPLRVPEFDVRHYRMIDGKEVSFGPIEVSTEPMLEDDRVTVTAKLDSPAYWYLIALTPDGKFQLFLAQEDDGKSNLPKKESDLPRQSAQIGSDKWYFHLTEGCGLQAFVVVASREKLPPFDKWDGRVGLQKHWKQVAADKSHGVWEYRDGEIRRISSEPRGPEKRPDSSPALFQEVCKYLEKLSKVEVIRAEAFAVRSKK
jgi:serine/threonine protein kinase